MMADSNITKQALANALKELMEETSFKRITVSDICERCNMNRKSFYYHFRDKYDLVNWIFDTEVLVFLQDRDSDRSWDERWSFLEKACRYFDDNRIFYHKVLQFKGQDSFSDHLREFMRPLLLERIEDATGSRNVPSIAVDFIVDGLACAFERWLLSKEYISADQFVTIMRSIIETVAIRVTEKINEEMK